MNLGRLSNHICAMANTSGGYIALGIDGNKNVKTDYFIGFKKKGFILGEEQKIEIEINNARINVEPNPTMNYRNIEEKRGMFYLVIKIENMKWTCN